MSNVPNYPGAEPATTPAPAEIVAGSPTTVIAPEASYAPAQSATGSDARDTRIAELEAQLAAARNPVNVPANLRPLPPVLARIAPGENFAEFVARVQDEWSDDVGTLDVDELIAHNQTSLDNAAQARGLSAAGYTYEITDENGTVTRARGVHVFPGEIIEIPRTARNRT